MIGSVLTLYLLPLAGAESAIALAILIAYYPVRGTLSIR
jgi:NADH-ubiquinone oxidoreductase chain 4L